MYFNRPNIARITKTVSTLMFVMSLGIPEVSAQSISKSPVLPDGLGLTIRFVDPQPGEMDLLAQTGSRIVLKGIEWQLTETEAGEYDFSRYDSLIRELEQRNIRVMITLLYTNPLYDQGLPPYTEAGRQAFTRWAVAAVQHFQGRNIIWQLWNEPNLEAFWKPQPNANHYAQLALSVGKAIRSVAPRETYIGPASSGIDVEFLETCFKAGLLQYWSGVSVHPYRGNDLENVARDYRRLRLLIAKYAPKNRSIPIISSEWGYTSTKSENVRRSVDEVLQGKLIARQWLYNLANDIPISLWHKWSDSGSDPLDREQHFGIVRYPYRPHQKWVYTPKPAYHAIKTLTKTLTGYRFNKRLETGNPEDYVLLFKHYKSQNVRLAIWTTSVTPHPIQIQVSPGQFYLVPHTGRTKPTVLDTGSNILSINATDAPQYVIPTQPNELLQVAAAWERVPLEIVQSVPKELGVTLKLKNPLSRSIQVSSGSMTTTIPPYQTLPLTNLVEVPQNVDTLPVNLSLTVQGMGTLAQNTLLMRNNPWIETDPITPPPDSRSVNLSELNSFQLTASGEHFDFYHV